ncbi:MAG: Phosphatidylserine/phosphatidylglycerophosphate/cardiolipinsynthase-like protein [Bacilli bacterium]|nr:Phosphatidylserine/phosphatidylglycerophosphate/cardiolipinsynthase-like protein [Bacilli bacterium]
MKKIYFVFCIAGSLALGGAINTFVNSPLSAKNYGSTNPTIIKTAEGGSNLSYAFTQAGDHPDNELIGVINQAQTSIDVAIYSLTYPDIINAILDAKSRGVAVRIISDKTEAKSKIQADALKQLKKVGIPIKINTHSGLMYLKVSIIDKKIFTSGSYNYSKAASTINDEVLIIDRDPVAATKWDEEFETMWSDNKKFADF